MALHVRTPLLDSPVLSALSGTEVRLKMEALQPPGSFKIRGIGHACETYAAEGARRFLSSSGGNAGIAAAHAGRRLGVPVTVVVPETTTGHARRLIQQEGAELIVHGASWQEAHDHALSLLDDEARLIHPFDDPLLWHGHATMIDEVAATGFVPDLVVVAVGGGGLLAGVAEGMARNGWRETSVLAVETEGADSYHRALEVGEPVRLPAIESVATSLGARQVCQRAVAVSGALEVGSVVVSDADALRACLQFLDDHRVLVEPACGAALAAIYQGGAAAFAGVRSTLVIVCGGATTTLDQLMAQLTAEVTARPG